MRIVIVLTALGLWAQPLKTIAEIQTAKNLAAGNDTSVLHGQQVKVRGVVLTQPSWYFQWNPPSTYRTSIWIIDPNPPHRGLQIRRQNTTDQPTGFSSLTQRQLVEIAGEVSYFNGEIQLMIDVNTPPTILNPNATIPAPQPLNLTALGDPTSPTAMTKWDTLQGSFVYLKNVRVVNSSTLYIDVIDNNGNTIRIFDNFGNTTYPGFNASTFPVNTTLDSLSGIVFHYKPTSGTARYEITPWHDSLLKIGNPVPAVSNLTRQPVCPKANDAVTVSVNATSSNPSDPIASVTLYWAMGSSTSYTAVPMSGSGTYTATIPAQAEGTYVHYYIEAQDQSGDKVRFPRFEPQAYRVNNQGCRISDIQYVIPSVIYAYNPSGRRDYLGSGYNTLTVTNVPGVVTSSTGDLTYIHIQEPGQSAWAGIWVVGDPSLDNLQTGDSVVITSAQVSEYFGLTRLVNATANRIGPASRPIQPILLPLNVIFGDTQRAATEPYESMLVRFRNDNPTQPLYVVQPKIDPLNTSHRGDYRIGMDVNDPLKGIRVLAGRQTNNVFSSLNVSYVNDSTWSITDGAMNPSIPLCVVYDSTTVDSLQGILTYQWNFIKLLPRQNADFFNVKRSSCRQGSGGGGGGSALASQPARSLSVYPNPATRSLTLSGSLHQPQTLEVYNSIGQLVERIAIPSLPYTLSVENYLPGIYFLRVGTYVGSFIRE
ncbi:MAG: T9SS type A sorting domain-containing protein [Bacteroidia bacterium]